MLWFSKKFTVIEIITRGFLPSLTIYLVAIAMMFKHIEPSSFDDEDEIVTKPSPPSPSRISSSSTRNWRA
jgi:hypothetical protein